jgi:hypothetical protein
VTGAIVGPGTDRRASFRDPPSPAPANLVVARSDCDPPQRLLQVDALTLHVAGGAGWIVDCRGVVLDRGESSGLARAWVRIAPGDLIRRCVATLGPQRESFRGVLTPALLFDALDLGGS